MQETNSSQIFKNIGYGLIVFGTLIFLLIQDYVITIIGIVLSILIGVMLIGFGEIIGLLQKSINNQAEIIKQLKTAQNTTEEENNN